MERCIFCGTRTKESVGIIPTQFMKGVYFAVCNECMQITPIIKLFKLADGMIRDDFVKMGVPIEKLNNYE